MAKLLPSLVSLLRHGPSLVLAILLPHPRLLCDDGSMLLGYAAPESLGAGSEKEIPLQGDGDNFSLCVDNYGCYCLAVNFGGEAGYLGC